MKKKPPAPIKTPRTFNGKLAAYRKLLRQAEAIKEELSEEDIHVLNVQLLIAKGHVETGLLVGLESLIEFSEEWETWRVPAPKRGDATIQGYEE